jgi:acetamidase/formamidase
LKESGFNFNLPGKQFPTVGLLASEFPEGHVQYFKLDTKTMTTEFKPGFILPLKPFPGTIAVGPDPNEPKEKAGPPVHAAEGPHQHAATVEERVEHGRERTARGFDPLSPGVSERRVDLEGRFALSAGERRSNPDGP